MLPSKKNSIIMEVWVIFLKKTRAEAMKKKEDKTHTSTQKSWNKGLKRPKIL